MTKDELKALREIKEIAEESLGEWSAITKLYSPEWAQPYHDIVAQANEVLEKLDTEEK